MLFIKFISCPSSYQVTLGNLMIPAKRAAGSVQYSKPEEFAIKFASIYKCFPPPDFIYKLNN